MAVYGYARVSTDRQAEDGQSLIVQQRQIEGQAMTLGLPMTRMFVERGISGSVPLQKREEGACLLSAVTAGDIIITPKLDRMFRSSVDALNVLADLQVRRVSLHMIDLGGDVTGNGISKLVFTILSAVAEAERDRIRERISDVKRDQRRRGRFLGGARPPFGYGVGENGDLVAIPAQVQAIEEMVRLRGLGCSFRQIAFAMRAAGHGLSHVGVKRVLDRLP